MSRPSDPYPCQNKSYIVSLSLPLWSRPEEFTIYAHPVLKKDISSIFVLYKNHAGYENIVHNFLKSNSLCTWYQWNYYLHNEAAVKEKYNISIPVTQSGLKMEDNTLFMMVCGVCFGSTTLSLYSVLSLWKDVQFFQLWEGNCGSERTEKRRVILRIPGKMLLPFYIRAGRCLRIKRETNSSTSARDSAEWLNYEAAT